MQFRCNQCGEAFAQEGSLKGHIKLAHPVQVAETPGSIEGRQLPFVMLEYGMDEEAEVPAQCEETAPTRHAIGDNLRCEKCGKSFRVKRRFDSHICLDDEFVSDIRKPTTAKKHDKPANIKRKNLHDPDSFGTFKVPKIELETLQESIVSNMFTCQECFKEFPSKSILNDHLSSHDRVTEDEEGEVMKVVELTGVRDNDEVEDSLRTEGIIKGIEDSESLADVVNECISDASTMSGTGPINDKPAKPNAPVVSAQSTGLTMPRSGNNVEEDVNRVDSPKGKRLSDVLRKLFECDLCGEVFCQKMMLEAHSEAIHYGKKYRCNPCGVNFKRRSNYIRHNMRSHSDVAYKCDKCPKAFAAREDLEQHMKAHLAKENNAKGIIQCADCDMVFVYKKDLKIHRREYHKVAPQITDEQPVVIPDFVIKEHGTVSVFRCSLCPRAFSLKTDLQRHFLVHSGEKPFACDTCASKFNRKSNLVRHRRLMHHINEDRPICVKTGRRSRKDPAELEPWEEEIRKQDEEMMKWGNEQRAARLGADIQGDDEDENNFYWEQNAESDQEADSLEVAYFKPDDKVTVRILTFE